MKFLFLWILLAVSISGFDDTDDFDEVARLYLQRKVDEKPGTVLRWSDLYGQIPETADKKIKVWADDVIYGDKPIILEKPSIVFSQRFDNFQSATIKAEFTRKVELKNTYTWTTTSKFSIKLGVKAKAGVPGVLDVTAKLSTSLDLQSTKAVTLTDIETYEAKHTLTILPYKSVKAELIITNKDMKVPWEADVQIRGEFVYATNKEPIVIAKVTELANVKFPLSDDGEGLTYRAKGIFRGLRGIDTHLKVTEADVQFLSHKHKERANREANDLPLPVNVTFVKLQLRKLD